MIELSREARTVLQCIDDLQFTGRPDPRRAEFLAGASALVFFDPVPFVAICGELAPVDFDIECQLRLLETEQAITHLIHNSLQIRTYTRPDGKTVTVDHVRDDDKEGMYGAAVNGQIVYEQNVHIPMNPGDRTNGLQELHHGIRIDCYRITALGRAALRRTDATCGPRDFVRDSDVTTAAAERPVPQKAPSDVHIPDYARKAGEQYKQAAKALGQSAPLDREAYDRIATAMEQSGEKVELQSFDTWQRSLREYRRLTGQQKNTPRAGRGQNSRSLVPADRIEPSLLPTRIRPKSVDE